MTPAMILLLNCDTLIGLCLRIKGFLTRWLIASTSFCLPSANADGESLYPCLLPILLTQVRDDFLSLLDEVFSQRRIQR